HRTHPLQTGITKEALRAAVVPDAPAFLLDALLGDLRVEGDLVRLESHRVALASGEEIAARAIEDRFRAAGLAVPAVAEVLASCGVEAARARTLLEMLVRGGKLIRVGAELMYHASAIQSLR